MREIRVQQPGMAEGVVQSLVDSNSNRARGERMRRVLFASLSLLALAWMSGCSNSSSGSAVANTTPSPSGLSGQFGFVLTGFDPVNSIVIAGSFTANGSGQITAGDV